MPHYRKKGLYCLDSKWLLKHGGIVTDVGVEASGSGTLIKAIVDSNDGMVFMQDLGVYKVTNGVPVECKFNSDSTPNSARHGVVIDGRSGQAWGLTGTVGPTMPAVHIQSYIESLDRWNVQVTSTAAITSTTTETLLSTGSTSGSVAQMSLNIAYGLSGNTLWSEYKEFSVAVNLPSGVTDADWVLSLGHAVDSVDAIRFSGNGDTLVIQTHDGSTNNTTTVNSSGYGGSHVKSHLLSRQ